jgi:hypothetical protein
MAWKEVVSHADCPKITSKAGDCIFFLSLRTLCCWPSLIIAGAMKSGTGALLRGLSLNPLFAPGMRPPVGSRGTYHTEVQFFGKTSFSSSSCPWRDYLLHFPVSPPQEQALPPPLTIDKSPSYIRSPAALQQLATMLPDTTVLVILRDPIRRALSEYRHHCLRQRYRLVTAPILLALNASLASLPPLDRFPIPPTFSPGGDTRVLLLSSGQWINELLLTEEMSSGVIVEMYQLSGAHTSLQQVLRASPRVRDCTRPERRASYYWPGNIPPYGPVTGYFAWREVARGRYKEQLLSLFNLYVSV